MIELHKYKGDSFWLNHKLIESIEVSHYTIIMLENERKYIVQETPTMIKDKIIEFEKSIYLGSMLR